MWQFAFSVSLEGGEGTEECKAPVEGDQVSKGGHCRAWQELFCSHQGSQQLWYKEPHKETIIVRFVL